MALKDIKVIVTAGGCPGASTLIRSLKSIEERKVIVIGTDIDSEAIGKFFADKFYKVPSASSPEYIPAIEEICEKEEVDAILPESSTQVEKYAELKSEFERLGVKVVVSDPEPIRLSNDKFLMYETITKNFKKIALIRIIQHHTSTVLLQTT